MQLKASTSCILILLLVLTFTAGIKPIMAVTWSVQVKRLTTDPYYDGFPAITQTTDAKLWVVWSKSILGNLTLYYKTSVNLGITWSEETNLTEVLTPGNNQNPSIIQTMNGALWVVWTSDRPPAPQPPGPDYNLTADPPSLIIPKGASDTSTITVTSINNFNDQVNLSMMPTPLGVSATLNPVSVTPPPNSTATSTLTVVVGPTATPGSTLIIVKGKADGIVRTVEIPLEITESAAATGLDQGASAYPSSTSTSAIYDHEIYYKISNDNGATWSSDTVLTNNNFDDLRPSICQLSNSTLFLVWQSFESGNHDIYYRTTLDGTTWSAAKQLTTYLGNDKTPSVTQTVDGKIWVAWSTDRTGDNEIFYKTYNGVSWSADTRLTTSVKSDVTPSILQTVDGNIYIFWCSVPDPGDTDIYYKVSSNNGATWSATTQFTTGNYEDMWPALMQTTDTKIRIVWVSEGAEENWDIYYRTSLAGDVNQDGVVDIIDLSLVAVAYGTFAGEPSYNRDADVNKDGVVDVMDISIVSLYFGET